MVQRYQMLWISAGRDKPWVWVSNHANRDGVCHRQSGDVLCVHILNLPDLNHEDPCVRHPHFA